MSEFDLTLPTADELRERLRNKQEPSAAPVDADANGDERFNLPSIDALRNRVSTPTTEPESLDAIGDEHFNLPSVADLRSRVSSNEPEFTVTGGDEDQSVPFLSASALKDSVKDLGVGYAKGSNNLLKIAGQAYGLVSGDMDNAAVEIANENLAIYDTHKSDGLLESEEQLQMDLDEADGLLSKAYTGFVGTLSDPRLAGNFVTEQLPMLVATMGGGAVAGAGAKAAGAGSTAQTSAAVSGALGTGASMQGASVGGETFDELMEQNPGMWAVSDQFLSLVESGMSEEDAKAEIALDLSRKTGLAAAAISLLVQKIPGAKALEKKLAGDTSGITGNVAARATKGFVGEGLSEGLEEAGGQFASNVGVQQIDPDKDLTEGVGEAGGQGAAGGLFGAGAAVFSKAKPNDEPLSEFENAVVEEFQENVEGVSDDVTGQTADMFSELDTFENEIEQDSDSGIAPDDVVNPADQPTLTSEESNNDERQQEARRAQQVQQGNDPIGRQQSDDTVARSQDEASGQDQLRDGQESQDDGNSTDEVSDDSESATAEFESRRGGIAGVKDGFVRKIVNKYETLGRLQDHLTDTGGKVRETSDVAGAIKLMHGQAANDLQAIEQTTIEPIVKILGRRNLSMDRLDDFAYARHAPERNKRMRTRFGDTTTENPSGMSEAESDAIIAEAKADGTFDDLMEASDIVFAQNQKTLERSGEAGLLNDDMFADYDEQYDYYVPLKGFAVNPKTGQPWRESSLGAMLKDGLAPWGKTDQQLATSSGIRGSRGMRIDGKEDRRALGRDTKAFSPVSTTISNALDKSIRARHNEVGNSFLELVESNPNTDMWEVYGEDDVYVERSHMPATKNKPQRVALKNMPPQQRDDLFFTTKRNGKQFHIRVKDKRVLDALNGMAAEGSNFVMDALRMYNRFLSNAFTAWNPSFVLTNPIRDIQTAILKLQAEEDLQDGQIKGENLSKAMTKRLRPSLAAMYRARRKGTVTVPQGKDPADYTFDEMTAEFKDAGGMTGYFAQKNPEKQLKELETELARMSKRGFRGMSRRSLKSVVKFVEDANIAAENMARLAAYGAAREAGVSKHKAALLAKDLTVDFNQRGENTTTLSAMYLFANPIVQGNVNLVRAVGKPKVGRWKDVRGWGDLTRTQRAVVMLTGASMGMSALNRALMGEGDDGEDRWDQLPDWEKATNFILPIGWATGDLDDYKKIPMPYGFNLFGQLGIETERVFRHGPEEAPDSANRLLKGILSNFSPIGFSSEGKTVSEDVLKTVLPTVFTPATEIVANNNFFGSTIYNKERPYATPVPESHDSRPSTLQMYKNVTEFLNDSTGGSEALPGAIDMSPEVLQYLVNYHLGGAGDFWINKVALLAYDASQGVAEAKDLPFVNRFSGKLKPFKSTSTFYDRIDLLSQLNDDLELAEENGDFEREDELIAKYGDVFDLKEVFDDAAKDMAALRKEKRDIRADDTLTAAEEKELLKALDDEINLIAAEANALFVEQRDDGK